MVVEDAFDAINAAEGVGTLAAMFSVEILSGFRAGYPARLISALYLWRDRAPLECFEYVYIEGEQRVSRRKDGDESKENETEMKGDQRVAGEGGDVVSRHRMPRDRIVN